MRTARPAGLLLVAGLLGCGSDSGTGGIASSAPFALRFAPGQMTELVQGQHCVLLLSLEPATGGPVTLRASATEAEVRIEPSTLPSDGLAEMTVVPKPGVTGDVDILVYAERGTHLCTDPLTLRVAADGARAGHVADLALQAAGHRQRLVAWLAAERPELGITADTAWDGTIVKPDILVVNHCLFFSDEWEMGLQWRLMTPPQDWSRIYLRRRFVDTVPSMAFEIPSYTTGMVRQVEPSAVQMTEITR